MQKLFENWRRYQEQELLKEEVNKLLFLFEEGNEKLLEESILNEGPIWNFIKNITGIPDDLKEKVLQKALDYLGPLLKKRGVKRVTRNNIIKTISSEKNIKLAAATIFALIGLATSAAVGADISQFIDSLGNSTVAQIYQAIDNVGDAKDMAVASLSMPMFGIASIIPKIKNLGLGVQDSTSEDPLSP